MKKTLVIALMAGVIAAVSVPAYASDWDKAGKALTIIEGLRVVTGGQVDLIGSLTGINRNTREVHHYYEPARVEQVTYVSNYPRHPGRGRHYGRPARSSFEYRECERVWVPDYVIERVYVPQRTEYHNGYRVIVDAHYEERNVERGGHWEESCATWR